MTTSHEESLDDDDQLVKDRSYSPSSERETAARQDSPDRSAATDDTEADVRLLPGTGGPDDDGEVHVDPGEVHLPHDTGAH